jgi:AcrR family transcriptional regulator
MSEGDHGSPSPRPPGCSCESPPARRRRFARAAAEVARGSGLDGITVAALAEAAGTPPDAFDETFSELGDCLRFGVLDSAERLTAPLRGVEGADWLERLEAAIGGYYAAIAAEPLLAELYLLHSHQVGLRPEDPGVHESVLAFVALLEAARAESGQESLPPVTEQFLAWAIVATAVREVRACRAGQLPGLSAEVTAYVALFYTPDDRRRRAAAPTDPSRRGPQPPEPAPSSPK